MNISTDILVAGGGVAGVAAAVAGARAGCRVHLVEREATLGGVGTQGMLGTICGLYENGGSEAGALLNVGIVREIVSGLVESGSSPAPTGKVFVLPYQDADLRGQLEQLCLNEPDLTVYLRTSVVAATVENGTVLTVSARQDGRSIQFCPKVVIDCTGDGDLAAMAGAPFQLSPAEQRQLAGFVVHLEGVAVDESLSLKVPFQIVKGIGAGLFPEELRYTSFNRGVTTGDGYLKINLPGTEENAVGRVRLLAGELVDYLAGELPALADATISETSSGLLLREGRRIVGEYQLTEDDILVGRKFHDGVVKGAWPMELWTPGRGVSYRYPPDGDHYEIPKRCLKSKDFQNLYASGRCIAVTHEALGSTRVMGCCIPLGEQAGRAAAAAVRSAVSR